MSNFQYLIGKQLHFIQIINYKKHQVLRFKEVIKYININKQ